MGDLRRALAAVRGDVPVDDRSFETLIDLLECQEELKSVYAASLDEATLKEAESAVKAGKPAASALGVWVGEEEFRTAVEAVARVVAEGVPYERSNVENVLNTWREGRLDLMEVAGMMLRGDLEEAEKAAAEAGVDTASMSSLVAWALQPAFTVLAEKLEETVASISWEMGRCPVCGSLARLGFYDGKGVFNLKCQFCGIEWKFPEDRCPVCGSGGELVSSVEIRDRPMKLSICAVCASYVKVVDERSMEVKVPREAYDVWTIALDVVAARLLGRA